MVPLPAPARAPPELSPSSSASAGAPSMVYHESSSSLRAAVSLRVPGAYVSWLHVALWTVSSGRSGATRTTVPCFASPPLARNMALGFVLLREPIATRLHRASQDRGLSVLALLGQGDVVGGPITARRSCCPGSVVKPVGSFFPEEPVVRISRDGSETFLAGVGTDRDLLSRAARGVPLAPLGRAVPRSKPPWALSPQRGHAEGGRGMMNFSTAEKLRPGEAQELPFDVPPQQLVVLPKGEPLAAPGRAQPRRCLSSGACRHCRCGASRQPAVLAGARSPAFPSASRQEHQRRAILGNWLPRGSLWSVLPATWEDLCRA